jgi:lipopolysaccharide/colanic/teichoic acid biosynthesis glycosyltransferase
MIVDDAEHSTPDEHQESSRAAKYAYMRRDGTLDIIIGSLIAGVGSYAFQFIAGRSLGEEQFAPIGVLLTAHFLAFLIILVPLEQFVIRRLTLGARGWVLPLRAVGLVAVTALGAAITVGVSGDEYFRFTDRQTLLMFGAATVVTHFLFATGRGYLAGFRRFRSYGRASAAASVTRVMIAIVVALTVQSITGYAWAHILGPLSILAWRPWRMLKRDYGETIEDTELDPDDDQWLLSGLVLSAAASQALLLATPLVASRLGASDVQYSVIYATLLVARAPLTIGYNLIARILPSFTSMAAAGERRELRAWARGIGIASLLLSVFGAILGAMFGSLIVGLTMGSGFAPSSGVAAMAGAAVTLAAGGLFIGQVLVAKSQPLRLAAAWIVALAAAVVTLGIPIDDPVVHAMVALVVGELVALVGLITASLVRDRDETEISHGYHVAKRSVDIGGALVLLVLAAPVLAVAAILVRLDSPGPAFFRQQRVGRNGQLFWMVKLRTMHIDHDDAVFSEHVERMRTTATSDDEYSLRIDDDPRVTRVGTRLRAWSVDELPNLWNVLKGSMSLVGPRPIVFEEAEIVGLASRRFEAKPGITGLAQVRGRDSIGIADRTALDIMYIDERTLKLDFEILVATVGTIFAEPGATGFEESSEE